MRPLMAWPPYAMRRLLSALFFAYLSQRLRAYEVTARVRRATPWR